jgi:tetratricopeptide (TPR) repeat protein
MARKNETRPHLTLLLAVVLLVPGVALAQEEEQGAAPPAPNEEPGTLDTLMEQTSEGNVTQAAMNHYYAGHRALIRAEKMEAKLDETEPSKREKAMAKIRDAYQEAADSYLQAIRTNPKLQKAYAELGQSNRALGKNAEAVQAYNAALKITPEDVDSIYGRGEAFLALNYLREAATTYTELVGTHDEHASRLMASLKKWVADHRANPGEIKPEAVETLGAWIDQQENGSG